MCTWFFRLNALDEDGEPCIIYVSAVTQFVHEMYRRFSSFLTGDSERFIASSNVMYENPIVVKRDVVHNSFIFYQEDGDWNFTLSEDEAHELDAQCERIALDTLPTC